MFFIFFVLKMNMLLLNINIRTQIKLSWETLLIICLKSYKSKGMNQKMLLKTSIFLNLTNGRQK